MGRVDPSRLNDEGHRGEGQLLNLVDARADDGPPAHDHGRRAVEDARDDDGLVRPAGHDAEVETHFDCSVF